MAKHLASVSWADDGQFASAGAAAVKASKGTNRLGVAVLIALAEVAVAALAKRADKPKRG